MTMLYFSQGTIRFPVKSGYTLVVNNISGVESVSGSTVPREDATSTIGSGVYVYGPQTSDATITLSTSGQCDYELKAGDATPESKIDLRGGDNSTSTALANSKSINSSLSSSNYEVVVAGNQGDLYVAQTIIVPSNKKFTVLPGTYLKRVPGPSYHLVRNAGAQNSLYVNGLTISGGTLTLNEPGHSRAVGDVVYLEGFTGNTALNGPKTVTSTTPGVSWSFAATGSNPTNTSVQCVFASKYNPLAGASLTRASNVVTVTEPGHTRGVGDHVYIGKTGLTATNSFGGVFEIASVIPGVSWTYANTGANETPTGTTHLAGDRGINAVLNVDGNSNNVTVSQATAHASVWANCSNSSVSMLDSRYVQYGRLIAGFNTADFTVPRCHASHNVAVGVQFDSFCDRAHVGVSTGIYQDDCIAWGVTSNSGPFGDTAAPNGPGNMGKLVVDSVLGSSPTGLIKMYAYTGYSAGAVNIRSVTGTGPCTIGDGSTGVGGGTFDELKFGQFKTTPTAGSNALSLGGASAWSTMGRVEIDEFVDNPATANDAGFGVAVMSPFDRIRVGTLACMVARTFTHVVSFQASGKVWKTDNLQGKSDSGLGVYNLSSGTVTDLFVGSGIHEGASANNGFLVYANGGFATNIYYIGMDVPQAGNLFYNASSAGGTWNIFAVNLKSNNMASGFGGNATGTYNIFLTNCVDTNVGNNYIQFGNAGQTIRVVASGGSFTVGKNVLLGTSEVLSINGPVFKGDFGANGANLLTYLSGAQSGDEVTNTNATGPGVYVYKGSSSSWVLRTAL